jgi:hypothetical protein
MCSELSNSITLSNVGFTRPKRWGPGTYAIRRAFEASRLVRPRGSPAQRRHDGVVAVYTLLLQTRIAYSFRVQSTMACLFPPSDLFAIPTLSFI